MQKRPPRFQKWLEQRPRQAYEDFGLRLLEDFQLREKITHLTSSGFLNDPNVVRRFFFASRLRRSRAKGLVDANTDAGYLAFCIFSAISRCSFITGIVSLMNFFRSSFFTSFCALSNSAMSFLWSFTISFT